MKILILISIILGLGLSGCVHDDLKIEESDKSLGDIKKAIVSVIGEPRKLSQNQREFTSQYTEDGGLRGRYYYVITILGPRRPYDIEIRAFTETRSGKTFEPLGESTSLAKKVLKELQTKLHQSRDGRNLIDDFRAF